MRANPAGSSLWDQSIIGSTCATGHFQQAFLRAEIDLAYWTTGHTAPGTLPQPTCANLRSDLLDSLRGRFGGLRDWEETVRIPGLGNPMVVVRPGE